MISEWKTITTHPRDRYILLFSPDRPRWDGNMDVGKWFGDETWGCFWSSGGPNGGLEIGIPKGLDTSGHIFNNGWGGEQEFTHWAELPDDAPVGE